MASKTDPFSVSHSQTHFVDPSLTIFTAIMSLVKMHVEMAGGSVAEWLERWTCNSEAPSSSHTLTCCWIYSRQLSW